MKLFGLCSFLFALEAVTALQEEGDLHNISLVVMVPFPGNLTRGWERGPALIPACNIAMREINYNKKILPKFRLKLIEANSGCSVVAESSISIVRDIYEGKEQVVGIIGPGCSDAALQVSDLTSKNELSLLHITPSATTPELEDAARNTTYATISSALTFVESYLELMKHNNWTRVATLQDISRQYFKQTHSRFRSTVDSSKVIYTGSLYKGAQSVIPLGALESSGSRIVMVFAGADIAVQMLCYAYHRKMMYPNYQWIFHDRSASQLVKNVKDFIVYGEMDPINCTEEQMRSATEGVILNRSHLEQNDTDTILPLFNKTYNEYEMEYKIEVEKYVEENNFDNNATNVYGNSYHDAVWAMALALHNASMNGLDLESYTYNKNSDTKKIAESLQNVEFKGVSGDIKFQGKTRSSATVIDISQLQNGTANLIASFDQFRIKKLKFENVIVSNFIDDEYKMINGGVHRSLGALIIILTLFLVFITAALQLAYISWSNYRSIKATSPDVSHLIYSGCYLFAIFILLYTVQESLGIENRLVLTILCNAMMWCLLLGYSLIFGTVCAKIWRIYRLFKHFRNESPGILLNDNALVSFVIVLLLIDVVLGTTWIVFDPLEIQVDTSPPTSDQVIIVNYECHCQHLGRWVGCVVAYKGVIVILLLVFSLLCRKIKRENFQHTKKVIVLIYSITLTMSVGLPLYFLVGRVYKYVGFLLLCIIFISIIFLCCLTLFLPPVLPILRVKITRGKEAGRVFRRRLSSITEFNSSSSVN